MQITAVATRNVGLEKALRLAAKRGRELVRILQTHRVRGTYIVNVMLVRQFRSDGLEYAVTPTGKPLSTVTMSYLAPVAVNAERMLTP